MKPRGPLARSTPWRQRLLCVVDETPPGGTCVIAAAPGYGATTLLRLLAETSAEKVLDLTSTAALHGVGMTDADWLHGQTPCWIVIDNVQDDAGLTELARALPPNARLAVATHESLLGGPSFAGRVVEISEDLLKLRLDESVELLRGVDLDEAEAIWVASDGCRRHNDRTKRPGQESRRAVASQTPGHASVSLPLRHNGSATSRRVARLRHKHRAKRPGRNPVLRLRHKHQDTPARRYHCDTSSQPRLGVSRKP